MKPILFTIFNINIYSYGALMAIGFILSVFSLIELGKKHSIDQDTLLDLSLSILIPAIVCARLLFILINLKFYVFNPMQIFLINKGGLVYYGGFIGGVCGALFYLYSKKKPVLKIGDMVAVVLPIGQMFGRIGCFLNGCCFGSPTDMKWRVIYPMNSHAFQHYQEFLPIHPVQLYESLCCGILFLFLATIHEHKKFDGQIISLYGIGYSLIRFSLEFIRGDNVRAFLGLTLSQNISIIIFIVSSIIYIKLNSKKNEA